MHNKGWMHRDIKPENILLTDMKDDAKIKLIDFGLSTKIKADSHIYLKCGTPGFVAPELFKTKKELNYT